MLLLFVCLFSYAACLFISVFVVTEAAAVRGGPLMIPAAAGAIQAPTGTYKTQAAAAPPGGQPTQYSGVGYASPMTPIGAGGTQFASKCICLFACLFVHSYCP